MRTRFTLIHGENSEEIAEPGGWPGHEIMLERHPEFGSLVESISSVDRLVFYGDDDEDGNGGIDFIRDIENGGSVNEKIELLIEYAPDDVTFEDYFRGLLQLEDIDELPENELEVSIIRDDEWSRFISRLDKPVDVMSTVDLDGNAVDPLEPVTLNLTSQKIRHRYHAYISDSGVSYAQFTNNSYYQIDFNDVVLLDELKEKHLIPRLTNTELPAGNFTTEFAGFYDFDIRIIASTFTVLNAESVKDPTDMIDYYIQFGNQSPIAFSFTDESVGAGTHTVFTYTASNVELEKNTTIRIYGQANTDSAKDLVILGGSSAGFSGSSEFASYCQITADTTYPDTQVEGFWAHDVADAIIRRICGYDGVYSDILGGMFTKARQYDENGCYSNMFLAKGVHIRGYTLGTNEDDPGDRYTLKQKPFTMSFLEWWDGMNPIFNLGLGYETLEDSPNNKIIRIEDRAHFYDDSSTSINFDHVYNIRRTYDKDYIFKTIKIGYEKWEAESPGVIDDPQTKHVYGTILSNPSESGKGDKTLHSGFIAASLTWETTRRTTMKQSADYRYDDNTFIVVVNVDNVSPETSPEVYNPELDENFNSVSNLLNSDTRYNLILTPMRNLFRWANYLIGCLQSYTSSSIKFLSGEGNFDMVSDYDCSGGKQCQAIICDELAESTDIPLTSYNAVFGYLHLALLYNIQVPMEFEDYKVIVANRKKPIGISQTDSGHTKFLIKSLRYNPLTGEAAIQAWPKTYMEIAQIHNNPESTC